MSKKYFLLLILITSTFSVFSQKTYQFKEGYFLKSGLKYGREALVQDEVAYQLFKGTLATPASGAKDFKTSGGESMEWQLIAVDTSSSFKGENLSEGYLYLQYDAPSETSALLNVAGHSMLFINGQPHAGDIYKYGWVYSPVRLKKGVNEILVRCSRWATWQGVSAKLIFPAKLVTVSPDDTTLPHIVLGEDNTKLLGGVVIVNTSDKELKNLTLTSKIEGKEISFSLPVIPAMSTRKVPFYFNGSGISSKNNYACTVVLKENGKTIDENQIKIDAVNADEHYSNTFISDIDGSVQYYSVAPQKGGKTESPALFLSVHGAEVQAISQARAYKPKDWGVLVAPTNRRPRGFNWEEWGRMDALEVLEIAKAKFRPDPERIYLTGHSMGGHGTWYLGATYPGKWAAIAPCAGYPTLRAYGSADGKIPSTGVTEMENLLLQASNPSNIIELMKNYNAAGIYIHHGDSDKVVSVDYARQMREDLSKFHKDFSYYEYPGGSHWFGDESVDWPPIFDYFKWHKIPHDSTVNVVDFTTSNPAISSQYHWVNILQQLQSIKYSRVAVKRDKAAKTIKGTTENTAVLALSLVDFPKGETVQIELDGQEAITAPSGNVVYLTKGEKWQLGSKPSAKVKGITRNGTFKEPFNHRMVFVYGTAGNQEENKWAYEKAVYDAEVWYYRGNGAVDIIADKDFNPSSYANRGVIIYGNSTTNGAWKKLLADCPVQVQRGSIKVGEKLYKGDDLAAYFMWPRADSEIASVAVISGTGLPGMRATESNQYFAAGSGFPDYMVFTVEMIKTGIKGIKSAGFYTNDWKIDKSNSVISE